MGEVPDEVEVPVVSWKSQVLGEEEEEEEREEGLVEEEPVEVEVQEVIGLVVAIVG